MYWKTLIFVLAATLVIAACGGDDDDTDATPTPAATGATATPGQATESTSGPPIDSGAFEIVSSTSFRNNAGLYFIGEMRNNSDKDAIVVLRLSLTDDAGMEVGTGEDRLQARPYLPPGETMAFKMAMAGAAEGQTWSTETFTFEGREATESQLARAYTDFVIEDSSTSSASQGITAQGILRNTGTESMNPIKIVFVARDADGKVSGAWGANPPGGLDAGAETIFGFPVLDVATPPPAYELSAYAYRP